MTHKDDFIMLRMEFFGERRFPIVDTGLDWPPPEFIVFDGKGLREATATDDRNEIFHRERFSSLTDEQMKRLEDRVARGAEYKYVDPLSEKEKRERDGKVH